MNEKLCRSSYDKKIFGVCGGIAHYFNVDSTIVRLLAAMLILFAGSGLLFYLLCAFIMPVSDQY